MSSFASRTQDTIPHPGDEPNTITIQRLSGRSLDKARQAKQIAAQAYVASMGGQAFRDQLAAIGDDETTKAAVEKAQADPLNAFDRYVVLYKGIVSWTCGASLTPVEVVNDDGKKEMRIPAIDDMDAEAVETVARAILGLTLPARGEAATKNGSGSSPAV